MLRPRLALTLALFAATAPGLTACVHHHESTPGGVPSTSSPGTLTQALWVANGTSVVEFLPSQVTAGGDQSPTLIDADTLFGAVGGVAFDAAGDLWVVDGGTVASSGDARPAIYEFTPSQLAGLSSNQSPVPTRTIEFAGFNFPQQARFDAGGNLWVTDSGSNAVYEFTPSQLAAGGFNVTPNVEFSSNPPFEGAFGIAFSPEGNLWVSNGAATTLEEFDADALPTAYGSNVTLAPHVTLQNNGQTIEAPGALAFDPSGNLWTTNANSADAVVKFPAASLGASGSPSVLAIMSASLDGNVTLDDPYGLAFDTAGDLAVDSAAEPLGIAFYGVSQLSSGGALTPHALIVGPDTTLTTPAGLTFGPAVN